MAAVPKQPSSFAITPHKLSICVLVQVYASPSKSSLPFPFSSVSQHNSFGIFLISLTKVCDGILETTLDELIAILEEVSGSLNQWFSDHLMQRLSSMASADDLFNFFTDLRGILKGSDPDAIDFNHTMLDPNSNLGIFVRRCLLAFNQMPFEAICHLLTNIRMYYKETLSGHPHYEFSHVDDSTDEPSTSSKFENMEMENYDYEKIGEVFEESKVRIERLPFYDHASTSFSSSEAQISPTTRLGRKEEIDHFSFSPEDMIRGIGSVSGMFLRTSLQVQGYLSEQANGIEKYGSSFPLNAFESILKKLQQLAPELHRVHYLRYLNNLYHDDYLGALENLHRYFDYSAGIEGVECVPPPSGCSSLWRYEIALLCLGMMHFHFGHPKIALEALTEAVRVSQQHSDDTCLAYTLVAISNLLSEVAMPKTSGVIGLSYGAVAGIGASLSVQQQLYLLIRRSLKRAESLKLKRLEASIHLEMAKFDLTFSCSDINFFMQKPKDSDMFLNSHTQEHVQRPLLSFGPKASLKLRTNAVNIYKELRLSCRIINEFDDENSVMATDGAFCTSWLKSLKKPIGSAIFSQEHESRRNSHTLQFSAQTISIPGSVLQLLGSSYLNRIVSWEMYGSATLARINALAFGTCFSDSSSLCDVALAYCKLIKHLAVNKGYKDAFAALRIVEDKFSSVLNSRVLLVKLQLLHDYALHRGNLKLAQQFCDELKVLSSSTTGIDMELKTEASLRHARTLLTANQYSQAAGVAHSVFCMCYKFNMQVKNASVLLLLAEIHKKSGNSVLGIPYALASLSYCQAFNLDLLKASAILTLAELWLSLGSTHAKKALSLLHGSFPILLGQGSLELRSQAFITEAKCYLADPSFSVSDNPEMVLEPLRQASAELQLLQYHELASEAFYLMAIVYDKLGLLDKREEAAASFQKHIIALENPQDTVDSLLAAF